MINDQKVVENNSVNKINSLNADKDSADTLAKIQAGLEKQIGTRAKVGGIGAALAMGGGLLGAAKGMVAGSPFGVVQNELMTRVLGADPVTAIGAAMGDKNAQQQMSDAYQKSMQT